MPQLPTGWGQAGTIAEELAESARRALDASSPPGKPAGGPSGKARPIHPLGASRRVLKRPQDIGLYCEEQVEGHCGVHALNALLGRRVADFTQVLEYQRRHWPAGGQRGHYKNGGWHSLDSINRWLYEHTTVPVLLAPIINLNWNDSAQVNAELERRKCTAAFLHRPGHFVCIAKSPVDQQWYLLDSIEYATHHCAVRIPQDSWGRLNGYCPHCLLAADAVDRGAVGAPNSDALMIPPPPDRVAANPNDIQVLPNRTRPAGDGNAASWVGVQAQRPPKRRKAAATPRPPPEPPTMGGSPAEAPPQPRRQQSPKPTAQSPAPKPRSRLQPPPPSAPKRGAKRAGRAKNWQAHASADPKQSKITWGPAPQPPPPPEPDPAPSPNLPPPQPGAPPANPTPTHTQSGRSCQSPQESGPSAPQSPLTTPDEGADSPPPSPAAPATPRTCPSLDSDHALLITTLNVRGLGTFLPDLHNLAADDGWDGKAPDILVLTETKHSGPTGGRLAAELHAALKGYKYFTSAAPNGPESAPRAGVIIALRRSTFGTCKLTAARADGLQGHYLRVEVDGGETPRLHIAGVYNPCLSSSELAASTRTALYQRLTADAHTAGSALIVAGDMNAAWWPTDRPGAGLSRGDKDYRSAVTAAGVRPLDSPTSTAPRARTFRSHQPDSAAAGSRIDDILVKAPAAGTRAAAQTRTVDMSGTETDHNALCASIPWASLGMQAPAKAHPPTDTAPRRVLKLPWTAAHKAALTAASEARLGVRLSMLANSLKRAVRDHAQPHFAALAGEPTTLPRPLRSLDGDEATAPYIDRCADELTALLQEMQKTAFDVCPPAAGS